MDGGQRYPTNERNAPMRKLLGMMASAGIVAAGVLAVSGTAHAADCTLVQSEIYTGANTVQFVRGLEGCEGDVQWEIQSKDSGSWTVADSGTTHYNNETVTYNGDAEYPCVLRALARYGSQEILTQEVRNNNCAG
jgi:hypothetical protein